VGISKHTYNRSSCVSINSGT